MNEAGLRGALGYVQKGYKGRLASLETLILGSEKNFAVGFHGRSNLTGLFSETRGTRGVRSDVLDGYEPEFGFPVVVYGVIRPERIVVDSEECTQVG